MEHVGSVTGGLDWRAMEDLGALYGGPGPMVTCYLDTDAASEDALHRIEIRWKDLRQRLEEQKVDRATLEALGDATNGARSLGEAVALVAGEGSLRHCEGGERPVGSDVAIFGPLPALGQCLVWRQHRIPYITVAADRAGADISATGPGVELAVEAGDRDAHDPELHKVHAGGWSHRRYQQRVENSWQHHADEVLDILEDLVGRVRPRLVLYGGDPQACRLLEDRASPPLAGLLEPAPISRSLDGSEAHEPQAVRRLLETAVAADTAQVLRTLEERAAHSLALTGAGEVLNALRDGAVEVLLVHDDPRDGRTVAFDRDGFGRAGEGPTQQVRLVDFALYLAHKSSARVQMVPKSPLTDGLGAILRFPDTPH